MLWDSVAERMDARDYGYMKDVQRTVDRVRATGEIFTPTALVIEMVRQLPIQRFAPGQTVFDPACGDGQFLVAAKWIKVLHFDMPEETAVKDLYGMDIMCDNVALCRRRLRCGGGTIVVGDALYPVRRVPGQTDYDRQIISELFS